MDRAEAEKPLAERLPQRDVEDAVKTDLLFAHVENAACDKEAGVRQPVFREGPREPEDRALPSGPEGSFGHGSVPFAVWVRIVLFRPDVLRPEGVGAVGEGRQQVRVLVAEVVPPHDLAVDSRRAVVDREIILDEEGRVLLDG